MQDPSIILDGQIEEIEKASLTPPDALIQLQKRNAAKKALQPFSSKLAHDDRELLDHNNPLGSSTYSSLTEFVEVSEFYESLSQINSKK